MTGVSEWHRAVVAVSGVTLVLVVAAGIHFIAPARPDPARPRPSLETATAPTVSPVPPLRMSPTTFEGADDDRSTPQLPRRVAAPMKAAPVPDVVAAELDEDVHARLRAMPRVASLEIPEDSVRLEPMRLPVTTDFDEPALPVPASDAPADRDAVVRGARPRDPVTAAFVTAGNAVAGGFRTAGRALKRAF